MFLGSGVLDFEGSKDGEALSIEMGSFDYVYCFKYGEGVIF